MSVRTDFIAELRGNSERHYNCAQSVLLAFCDEANMDQKTVCALCAHFGSGMRVSSVCGAVTGGLMALGILGAGEEKARQFLAEFKKSEGDINCAPLLEKVSADLPQKKLCDGLIIHSVNLIESLL